MGTSPRLLRQARFPEQTRVQPLLGSGDASYEQPRGSQYLRCPRHLRRRCGPRARSAGPPAPVQHAQKRRLQRRCQMWQLCRSRQNSPWRQKGYLKLPLIKCWLTTTLLISAQLKAIRLITCVKLFSLDWSSGGPNKGRKESGLSSRISEIPEALTNPKRRPAPRGRAEC